MKKIVILILIVFLTGCFGRLKTYEEIDYQTYTKMIDNKEDFVLVIAATSCSACAIFKETLNDVVSDKQVKIYEIDVEKMSEEDYKKFHSVYNYSGTPTTIFIKDGKETSIYDRINNVSYDELVEKLSKMGFLKG